MSNQKTAINGAKWTTVATIITTVLGFVQLAVVAKVLEPSIFGLVSVCQLVLNFFHIFANLGFTNSIISKQETDRKILSTIFFASIGLGVIMGSLIYLSAGPVADYYNEPKLVYAIRVSSWTFPLIYLSQIYWNLLQKDLEFKALGYIEAIGSIISIILTVVLAYNGFEERSLIYSQLFVQGVRTVLFIVMGRKLFNPVFYFKLKEIKDHLRFGIYHLGDGILGFVNSNLENIVIGRAIGIKELGLYTIAYQLAVFPIYRLNPIIMQVSYPIMARMNDDSSLKRAYLKIIDFISCVNFPLLAGLFITSGSVVVFIYGGDYAGAVPLVKIIVFVSFICCITVPASSIAMSKNKPNLMFYLALSSLIIKIPVLYFMSKYFGLLGIAYGYVITTAIEAIIIFYLVGSLIGSVVRGFLINIIKPTIFCLVMVAVISVYQHFIGNQGLIHIIAQVAIGGIVYLGLILKFKLSFKEIMSLRQSL